MKRLSVEFDKVIFTHVLIIGIPTIFFYCLRLGGWSLIGIHVAIATFYVFSSIMLIIEGTSALFRRFAVDHPYKAVSGRFNRFYYALKARLGFAGARRPGPRHPVPRSTFIVAAYLPNEQDIILETLEHILLNVDRPADGMEVILAYNTPVDLPIEDDLHRLAQLYPELILHRVEGSCSKAENINAVLHLVTGEVTCILDADHHPAADCFVRAWRWLEQDYDVVQGRSVIRNHAQNLLTQNIAIEFEMMYGVAHVAKSLLTDSSIFGGSNGYWRTSVLKRIRFNPIMLTEDIDASMRSLLNGYRILHDRSIISTELAPVDFRSFWFQRKRWAQGWLEVSLKYQRRVWKSDNLNIWQKVFWTYLLYYCEFYSLVAIQIIPIILSLMLYHSTIPDSIKQYLWFSTVISFLSGLYQTLITAKISTIRYPILYYIQHIVLLIPYITLKNMISIVAFYDHVRGNNNWLVTSRGKRWSKRAASGAMLPVPKPSVLNSTK